VTPPSPEDRRDLRARDRRGRTSLHRAALDGDSARCESLLALGADSDALDDDGRSAAELVPHGDPSCDPQDVSAWRWLAATLAEAERAARARTHERGFDGSFSTRGVREWTLRSLGSLLDGGGGERWIECARCERDDAGTIRLSLVIRSELDGVNPAFDPPWTREDQRTVVLDARGWPVSFGTM
jgi:hypothetical protein